MTENTTLAKPRPNLYRAALDHLATEHGLSGAEELAEKVAATDPALFTPEDILEGTGMHGIPVEAALGGLTNAERMLIVYGWARTYVRLKRRKPEWASLDAAGEIRAMQREFEESGGETLREFLASEIAAGE